MARTVFRTIVGMRGNLSARQPGRVVRLPGSAWLVVPVVAAAVLSSLVIAQQPKEPAKPAPAKPAKAPDAKTVWDVRFEKLDHIDATGEGTATKVVATSDEGSIIVADLWKWNDKTKIALASGNLSLVDEELEATAQSVEVHYKKSERLMILTGSVKLLLKPKKKETDSVPAAVKVEGGQAKIVLPASREEDEEERARDYPVEIRCDRVEYRYARDRKEAKLTGSFRATQKLKENTRKLEAAFAEFFGKEDRVVLHGPVKFEDSRGRKGETEQQVVLSTKEGAETLTLGRGRYSFVVEDEEDEVPPKPGRDQKPPPARPKPP